MADKAHQGEPANINCPNELDDERVAAIKRIIRVHQETFFSGMKAFQVPQQPFRHKPVMEKHEACFIAVAVLVQYGIENGSPLFHI